MMVYTEYGQTWQIERNAHDLEKIQARVEAHLETKRLRQEERKLTSDFEIVQKAKSAGLDDDGVGRLTNALLDNNRGIARDILDDLKRNIDQGLSDETPAKEDEDVTNDDLIRIVDVDGEKYAIVPERLQWKGQQDRDGHFYRSEEEVQQDLDNRAGWDAINTARAESVAAEKAAVAAELPEIETEISSFQERLAAAVTPKEKDAVLSAQFNLVDRQRKALAAARR